MEEASKNGKKQTTRRMAGGIGTQKEPSHVITIVKRCQSLKPTPNQYQSATAESHQSRSALFPPNFLKHSESQ